MEGSTDSSNNGISTIPLGDHGWFQSFSQQHYQSSGIEWEDSSWYSLIPYLPLKYTNKQNTNKDHGVLYFSSQTAQIHLKLITREKMRHLLMLFCTQAQILLCFLPRCTAIQCRHLKLETEECDGFWHIFCYSKENRFNKSGRAGGLDSSRGSRFQILKVWW